MSLQVHGSRKILVSRLVRSLHSTTSVNPITPREEYRTSKNRLQRQVASYVLGFVTLCALTVSSIAKADDCDTPSAESCACRSQIAKSTSRIKPGSQAVAVAREKTARHTAAKPPPKKERPL
jgi:hypothetical protein